MIPFRIHHLSLVALTVLVAAVPAAAVDGVIEINQASALAGGITASDQPGFPVTIGPGDSGSYRLTSNLSVADANVSGILVTTVDVTIDLNGFTIDGPTVCTGIPPATVTCVPENLTSAGIQAELAQGLSVRNGTIRNMPYAGVACERRCSIRSVRAVENGRRGFATASGSLIVDSLAHHNGQIGIFTGAGSPSSQGNLLSGNVATANGSHGFSVATGDVVEDNVAQGNGGSGIVAATMLSARNTSSSNGADGIRLISGLVSENQVLDNEDFGIFIVASGSVAMAGNSLLANGLGTISGTPVQIGVNACGNAVCP